MTSIAFTAGVIPLVLATVAGAEMRHAMGNAVFSGMIGVTVFGLIRTVRQYRPVDDRLRRPESSQAFRDRCLNTPLELMTVLPMDDYLESSADNHPIRRPVLRCNQR